MLSVPKRLIPIVEVWENNVLEQLTQVQFQKKKHSQWSLKCVSPSHPLDINLFWESMFIEDTGEETILSQPGIKTLSSLIWNTL